MKKRFYSMFTIIVLALSLIAIPVFAQVSEDVSMQDSMTYTMFEDDDIVSAMDEFIIDAIVENFIEGFNIDPSYEIIVFNCEEEALAFIESYRQQLENPRSRNTLHNWVMMTYSNQGTHARINFWNIALDSLDSLTGSILLCDNVGRPVANQRVSETRILPMTFRQYNVFPVGGFFSGGSISIVAQDGLSVSSGMFYF